MPEYCMLAKTKVVGDVFGANTVRPFRPRRGCVDQTLSS
jgi:hypothetical protein